MIKFKTLTEAITIRSISVERESKHCIWINGNRLNKRTEYEVYHDSKKEAIDYILRRLNTDIELAENKLNAAKDRLKRFNEGMND